MDLRLLKELPQQLPWVRLRLALHHQLQKLFNFRHLQQALGHTLVMVALQQQLSFNHVQTYI